MADANLPPDVSQLAATKRAKGLHGQSMTTSGVPVGYSTAMGTARPSPTSYVPTTQAVPRSTIATNQKRTLPGSSNPVTPTNPSTCSLCGKSASYLCSKCCQAWYCGRECQKTHWKTHRPDCSDERRWQVAQQANVPYNPVAIPSNPVGSIRPSAASTAVPNYGMSRPMMRATTPTYGASRYGYAQAPNSVYTMPPQQAYQTPITSQPTPNPMGTATSAAAAPARPSAAPTKPIPAATTTTGTTATATSTTNATNQTSTTKPNDYPPCAVCGKGALCKCSLCWNEFYCGRDCQVKAWNTHKLTCPRTINGTTASTGATAYRPTSTPATNPGMMRPTPTTGYSSYLTQQPYPGGRVAQMPSPYARPAPTMNGAVSTGYTPYSTAQPYTYTTANATGYSTRSSVPTPSTGTSSSGAPTTAPTTITSTVTANPK
eukprot:m.110457 g.110457  ORF g.110457 m.110457 type:complete len:431 (+) comp15365_c0_seq20:349-1641(+)